MQPTGMSMINNRTRKMNILFMDTQLLNYFFLSILSFIAFPGTG
jgi:hypothetical protein